MNEQSERARTRERVRASNREAYREAIVASAAEVFGRVGYRAAKIADIAEAAGVATGTVYNYFDNKEAVFATIVERGCVELMARLDLAVRGRRGLARLRELLATFCVVIEEQAEMFAVYVEATGLPYSGVPDSDPGIEAGRSALTDRFRAAILDAIELRELREDMPVDDLVAWLSGAIGTLMIRWISRPLPRGSLGADGERMLDVFLHGAARRGVP